MPQGRTTQLGDVLEADEAVVQQLVTLRPALLERTPQSIARFVEKTAFLCGVAHAVVRKFVTRCPAIATQRPGTIHRNACALAEELSVSLDVLAMATGFPQLLYLKAGNVGGKLHEAAKCLHVEPQVLVVALWRSPTLAGRDPVKLARRVRLCIRIARALGMSPGVQDILELCPAAPTYSTERLLLRYLMARLGIWKGSWNTLVLMSDKSRRASLATPRRHACRQSRSSPAEVDAATAAFGLAAEGEAPVRLHQALFAGLCHAHFFSLVLNADAAAVPVNQRRKAGPSCPFCRQRLPFRPPHISPPDHRVSGSL